MHQLELTSPLNILVEKRNVIYVEILTKKERQFKIKIIIHASKFHS